MCELGEEVARRIRSSLARPRRWRCLVLRGAQRVYRRREGWPGDLLSQRRAAGSGRQVACGGWWARLTCVARRGGLRWTRL